LVDPPQKVSTQNGRETTDLVTHADVITLAKVGGRQLVDALNLKEGDEIEISIAGKRDFKVARDRSKERALEQLRQMKWSFPPDFKFNREEMNER
jgi:antitoxin MazE